MEEHINLLELKAVRRVLERWDVKGPVDVKVVMDSTSAIGQIRRGYARRFASNEEVKRLKKFLMHKGINITSIEYITSAMTLRTNQAESTTSVGLAGGNGQRPSPARCPGT